MNFRVYFLIGVVFLFLAAGLLLGRAARASAAADLAWAKEVKENLFARVDAESRNHLLDAWRWKVGDEAAVFRVTVFGDVFTQTQDGSIYFLGTDSGQYVEVAESPEKWAEILEVRGSEWFHWEILQELRSLGVELAEGHVFDWQQSPMLGGKETVENIQWVSAVVRVSAAGQLAKAVKDGVAGRQEPRGEGEDTALYNVVINSELQYSIWPVGREFPAGWKSAGKAGTKQECLEYIKEVWTDMRPLSLRKKLEEGERRP
jgi:MbtH protein